MEELKKNPLIQDLPETELEWLLAHSRPQDLSAGDIFVREGDPPGEYYIVLQGELQIIRREKDGKESVLGTTPVGVMGGEISLLLDEPSIFTARAILPSRLLVLDQKAFRELFANCPMLARRVFQTAAERAFGLANNLKQQEKLAAMGKLSAGLAHELNNPSAASGRAAKSLRELLPELQASAVRLNRQCLPADLLERLLVFQQEAQERAKFAGPLLPLERADREEELGRWLAGRGVEKTWKAAATFAAARVQPAELDSLLVGLPPTASQPEVLAWIEETLCASQMLVEIEESTRRISELVRSIKEYTYMDQTPLQAVDVHKGLENTLIVLGHKLHGVTLVREYDPNLPQIQAHGSDLNQVWTNLIDNAIDATGGKGEIRLITRCENSYVMVEVTDSGPGIPPEVLEHLFEPFFTTKEIGVGTGLGLDITYRIVHQHNGTIEVQSEPGRTRFIVRLPVANPGEG
ncbi:MAG TPA: ATP-binding protein [Anaerolineaceae bacterium]|nr:ATP-binding protein [Anaerolineaceae bacterium]